MRDGRFLAVDVEGNGSLWPDVVELAIVEVVDLALTGRRWRWLVRPRHPITPYAERLHGITNEAVAELPRASAIVDDVMAAIDGDRIVAHNAGADLKAMRNAFPDWKPAGAVDTLRIAKALRPEASSYALARLGAGMGLLDEALASSGSREHRAPFDAALAALVFVDLMRETPASDRAMLLAYADVTRGPLI